MNKIIKTLLCAFLSSISLTSFALPNPAALNCANQNLKYTLIENTGICIFLDGSYCEEWAYLRGKCNKGQNSFPGGKLDEKNLDKYCIDPQKNNPLVILCNSGANSN